MVENALELDQQVSLNVSTDSIHETPFLVCGVVIINHRLLPYPGSSWLAVGGNGGRMGKERFIKLSAWRKDGAVAVMWFVTVSWA